MDSDLRALLQKQHEELLRTLDAWFLTSPKVSPVTSPHINSVTVKAAGLPNENSEDTLNRLKATSIATNEKPLGFSRLNSYEEAVVRTDDLIATLSNSPTFPSLTVELGEGPCAQCWHQFQRLAFQFVSSYWANVFFAFAILSNSVFLGVQIEWRVENLGIVTTNPFVGVHLAYAVLFTCEAALRYCAVGLREYFCGIAWTWNLLDVFVVVSSWFEIIADFTSTNEQMSTSLSNTNLRLVRILRMGRLLRVFRVIRVVRIFKALRKLVASLVDTTKSLIWAMFLLGLIIYIFSILFTDIVLDFLEENLNNTSADADVQDNLQWYFGNIYTSGETLFRSLLCGFSWIHAADALWPVGTFWVQLFHFYMAFCTLAVMNVITGVFCNSAIKAAERDHDMVVQALLQNRQEFKTLVSDLFHRIDDRHLGKITLRDLERSLNDEVVKAFFESLEIGAIDAWTLFIGLDMNGDYMISVEEFMERCCQLRGPARSADLFGLKQQQARLREQMRKVEMSQYRLEEHVRIMGAHDFAQPQQVSQVHSTNCFAAL